MEKGQLTPDYLFEVSWEVCNLVGGIYTVLSTKAKTLQKINKDKNQRIECGCVESVEVGTYNTCKNGCVYCYANYSAKSVESNFQKYDPLSPLLCGHIEKDDRISTRKVVSLKETQISIFDI